MEQQTKITDIKNRPEISTADLYEFSEWFKFFDKDGNGLLDQGEFKKALYAMGWNPTENELEDIWTATDKDGNGLIDREEYLRLLTSLRKDIATEKAELIEAFRRLDRTKSYTMKRNQMKRCFEMIGCAFGDLVGDDLDTLLDRADTNGDGLIDIEEFVTIMLEKPLV